MIPSILTYLDYRAWLKDAYAAKKKETKIFSYRFMAKHLEMDAGHLVRILQGKLHLPERAIPGIQRLFALEGRDLDFLQELVAFSKSKARDTTKSFKRLMDLKSLESRTTEDRHASYYLEWRHTVVRGLIAIGRFRGDFEALGRMCDPVLSATEAQQSVELLESLEFIDRDARGFWRLRDTHLVQGKCVPPQAVRKFQADVLQLAERALYEISPEDREISTQTVTLSQEDLPVIQGWVADFWRQVQLLTQNSVNPDRVCQLGVLVFPVGRLRGGKDLPQHP